MPPPCRPTWKANRSTSLRCYIRSTSVSQFCSMRKPAAISVWRLRSKRLPKRSRPMAYLSAAPSIASSGLSATTFSGIAPHPFCASGYAWACRSRSVLQAVQSSIGLWSAIIAPMTKKASRSSGPVIVIRSKLSRQPFGSTTIRATTAGRVVSQPPRASCLSGVASTSVGSRARRSRSLS
jgi:hypothetical protein